MAYTFDVCRICLSNNRKGKFISLNKPENAVLLENFYKCFGSKLSKDRKKHILMCKICILTMNKFSKVVENVQQHNKLYANICIFKNEQNRK
ncbi:unnamed protein product [Chironomus riparius]|uniref:ZAD domain-containing protein n=1 Tax=Chironomus riparius TaxID=315576 RepID=A0A9N9WPB6_9DIPT|nr:unnamed protein product [Chironomus riparius]